MIKSIIWIDLINPSDVQFFRSLISDLSKFEIFITLRDRAETIDLATLFGINGERIGVDYQDRLKKSLSVAYRTLQLQRYVNNFDYALSFEDGMSVAVSRFRKKTSLLFCDNDLKFLQKKSLFQDLEMKIKSFASYIIIPDSCSETFYTNIKKEKIIAYPGYKEDVYISDFTPDPKFNSKIPFDNYVVLRPEALGSFYVKENKSIVTDLIKAFIDQNINVVYLPRESEDVVLAKGYDVYIPKTVLNGLDLCYHADAILTGSGTLAREAACMGNTAVSFFPSKTFLSVDKKLIDERKMLHSRDIEEIVNYVISRTNKTKKFDLERCKKVKDYVVKMTIECLDGRAE